MMKKHYMILLVATCLLVLGISPASQAEFMLLVGKKTTVMDKPDGAKTCLLYDGAMVQVIEEQEGWMKVQVTGWIKKPGTAARTSAADDEDENKDIKEKGRRVVDIIKGEKTSE